MSSADCGNAVAGLRKRRVTPSASSSEVEREKGSIAWSRDSAESQARRPAPMQCAVLPSRSPPLARQSRPQPIAPPRPHAPPPASAPAAKHFPASHHLSPPHQTPASAARPAALVAALPACAVQSRATAALATTFPASPSLSAALLPQFSRLQPQRLCPTDTRPRPTLSAAAPFRAPRPCRHQAPFPSIHGTIFRIRRPARIRTIRPRQV